MSVDGVGPAKALAVAREDQAADKLADRATLVAARERAHADVARLAAEGVRTIGFFDEAFPFVLRSIPSPSLPPAHRSGTTDNDQQLTFENLAHSQGR